MPYISDDDVLVPMKNKDGKIEDLPYRANKYIRRYFKNQDNLTKYLFDKDILTYELMSEITGIKVSRLKSLMRGKLKRVDADERKQLEIFFNKDYYKKLGNSNPKCDSCKKQKKCGQYYWVNVVCCPNFTKK